MKFHTLFKLSCATLAGLIGFSTAAWSQTKTEGSVSLQATLIDYPGNSDDHWALAWVETASGTFIKTLWKQGPSSFTTGHWNDHCPTWYTAKGSSTSFDGYTTGTARNYTAAANNPVAVTWNCQNASGNLVEDGNYRFWIEYSEDDDSNPGPHTTSGLLWTKGPTAATNTYPNQASNFSGMKVTWLPTVAPSITSPPPSAPGIVGVPYLFTSTATGTDPIGFSATGLPSGLAMSEAGAISGVPTAAGLFAGTVTATNGVLPNATQPFSLTISEVPSSLTAFTSSGPGFVISGSGPTNGVYSVMTTTDLTLPLNQWIPTTSGTFDSSGGFSSTNTPSGPLSPLFYQLRIP